MDEIKWHIGCSGFHYKEWKSVFYPEKLPQKKWFEFYSTHFDTLELNVTFYRFPQMKFLENWYAVSPAEFRFAVKAPRLITHFKQFQDVDTLLDDFYKTIQQGLREKLGSVLFQLPPKYDYTEERLNLILQQLKPEFRNVIEFRHVSWWNESVYAALKKNNIIFCGISHPTLPDSAVVNNTIAYYRFHGVPKLYYSVYDIPSLKKVGDSLKKSKQSKQLKEAYIYFNNTAEVGAIRNAEWLRGYLRES